MVDGAIAGVAARTASAPFDLLKIRFQMQQRAPEAIWTVGRQVLRREGFLVLPLPPPRPPCSFLGILEGEHGRDLPVLCLQRSPIRRL